MGNGPVLAAWLRLIMKHDSLKILTSVGVFIRNNYTVKFEHARLILKWTCIQIKQENRNLFWVNPDVKDVYG